MPAGGTIVIELAGDTVSGPEAIRATARRLVEERERGLDVVALVPTPPATENSLRDLAGSISPTPDGRELDMLLSAGGRVACALVAMAIHDLGHEAVSLTGSQAGVLRMRGTPLRRSARSVPTACGGRWRTARSSSSPALQGFARETMDLTTLGEETSATALAAALGARHVRSAA